MICTLLFGCTSERIKILNEAEEVLPGNWQIESLRLPADHLGTTYQGNTFYVDTTLSDVGTIEIPVFSADTLDFNSPIDGKVRIEVNIDQEIFPFAIHYLLPYYEDSGIFLNIHWDFPAGVFVPQTDAEKFLLSSFILNENFIIQIIDNDHIEMRDANQFDGQKFTLKRIL